MRSASSERQRLRQVPLGALTRFPLADTSHGAIRRRVPVLNIEVDDLDMDELMDQFDEGLLVTPNVDHLMLLQRDPRLLIAYREARFVTVDSQVLFKALRWLGRPVRQKLSGSDILPTFCRYHAARARSGLPSARMFLLGGKDDTARKAMEAINTRVGHPLVVGAVSPSMSFVEDEHEIRRVIERIEASGADTLVVGLGTPKQEIWLHEHRGRMPGVRRFLAVGASLDFEAGVVPRAPQWASSAGLEWAYRLAREPRRLWRRYLVRDPKFFALLLREKAGRYVDPLSPMDASSKSDK